VYRWDPADYQAHSPAQKEWADELIEKIGLAGTERVLDIGCGDGKITAGIAGRVPDGFVLGIDSSPDMIRFAEQEYPEERYPNLSFLQMDMRDIGFSESFDIVFSNAAMHWVADHRPVLAAIRMSLVRGGRLLFQMGGQGNAARFVTVLDTIMAAPSWEEYFRGFSHPYYFPSAAEYRPLLEAAGFDRIRVELIPKTMAYPDRDGVLGWMRTTWLPYTQRAPERVQQKFLDELLSEYLSRFPPDPDGCIRVPMVRLEAEAFRSD